MAKLKPPKNYRRTEPRCCVTCVHYIDRKEQDHFQAIPTHWQECERDGTGTQSEEDYARICDYYKAT